MVGGAITILKNISQWEGLSHILWKIQLMFQTTDQISYPWIYRYLFLAGDYTAVSTAISGRCANRTFVFSWRFQ